MEMHPLSHYASTHTHTDTDTDTHTFERDREDNTHIEYTHTQILTYIDAVYIYA